MNAVASPLDLLSTLIARAKAQGADAADAVMFDSASLSVSWRLGRLEDVERSENRDLGLRVFFGKSQASASSTRNDTESLAALVDRVVAMAKAAPPDPYCGLADPALLEHQPRDLDLYDPVEPEAEALIARAAAAEDAARAVPGVTNSEGAGAGWGASRVAMLTSHGFAQTYRSSSHSVSVSVVAGEGTGMERDYDYSSARHCGDLADPAEIGASAGRRAVERLNPSKVGTSKVPVVFDPRVSSSLVGHLIGAITGPAIARGTSFLKDRLGQRIFAEGVVIVDDPHRKRGLRSRPFDGEGVRTSERRLIDDGVLTTWLLDSASARQLGLVTTGNASRGTSGPPGPSPSNLYMAPGKVSREALIGDIAQGFYVTELIGFGINGVTGDYSRGAAGFWIENGKLARPVSELTIAGNLKDMFLALTPADDLVFRYGTDAPTIRVDGMTVAGR
jgi:PmbA protein